ncbi:MAG: hypothetical protein HQK53_10700 [Oligoflexia bacterium]|nr:hypothetical protein [Oligoflexia bacterium]
MRNLQRIICYLFLINSVFPYLIVFVCILFSSPVMSSAENIPQVVSGVVSSLARVQSVSVPRPGCPPVSSRFSHVFSATSQNLGPGVQFNPQSQECNDWLEAYGKICGPRAQGAIRALINNTQFITTNEFLGQIVTQLSNLLRQDETEKRWVFIVDPGKSSEWTTFHALQQVNKIADLVARLGNYEIVASDNVENFLNGQQSGSLPIHFIRLDDTSYSGKQISGYVTKLSTACVSYAPSGGGQERPVLHIITQYQTQIAETRIQSSGSSVHNLTLDNTSHARIISVLQKLDSTTLSTVGEMYPNAGVGDSIEERFSGIPNSIYEFKVPDNYSAFLLFVSNLIVCPNTNEELKTCADPAPVLQFACIPDIWPPYKEGGPAEPTLLQRCANDPQFRAGEECKKMLSDRAACVESLARQSADQ